MEQKYSLGIVLFVAGLIGAAEVSAVIFWTRLALLGEREAQIVFRSNPPFRIFQWSVPIGAIIGIFVTVFAFNLWKLNGLSLYIIFIWITSTIVGYPFSFLSTILSAFGLSSAKGACVMSTIPLIITVCIIGYIGFTKRQRML